MFRKVLLLSGLLLSALSMTSCNSNDSKVMNLKSEMLDSYVTLTSDELSFQLTANGDFVLVVSQVGCLGCSMVKNYLRTYVSATKNIIYDIDIAEYGKIVNTEEKLPTISGTPSILFFKDGSLMRVYEGAPSEYSAFESLLNKYIADTQIYSLNSFTKVTQTSTWYYTLDKAGTDVLDAKIASDPSVTVFFTWLVCGDCQNFHHGIYDKYVSSLPEGVKSYEYEVNHYRSKKPNIKPNEGDEGYDDYMLWLNFANKYSFGSYRDGKVPVLVNYQNGSFNEMAVFANDNDIRQDADGLYYYAETFFKEIQDIKVAVSTDLKPRVERREIELMREFMDKYILGESDE